MKSENNSQSEPAGAVLSSIEREERRRRQKKGVQQIKGRT